MDAGSGWPATIADTENDADGDPARGGPDRHTSGRSTSDWISGLVDELEVLWPSGERQVVDDIAADQMVSIDGRGDNRPEVVIYDLAPESGAFSPHSVTRGSRPPRNRICILDGRLLAGVWRSAAGGTVADDRTGMAMRCGVGILFQSYNDWERHEAQRWDEHPSPATRRSTTTSWRWASRSSLWDSTRFGRWSTTSRRTR